MKLSVGELIFGAPRLLEWLGWSITKRPHLLGPPTHPYCHALPRSTPNLGPVMAQWGALPGLPDLQ